MDVGGILTVLGVAGLWVAAIVLGRDTRDGGDWRRGGNLRARPRRLGD